jgi:hypothetical protein
MATTETPAQVAEVEEPKTPPPAQAAEVEEPFDKDRAMRTIENLRAIEKQAKKDAKELETLKAEAQKRADAELSETERLKKQAETTAAENAQLKLDILRRDVIAETGLPPIFADRLKGETKEAMIADAQELAKTLPTLKQAPRLNATNPANAQQNETDAQQRERLFGKQRNIFDMNAIREAGGGVVWHTPPEAKGG